MRSTMGAVRHAGALMPRFSANISLLFTELDPLDRVAAARDAGFEGIEIQFPYDLDPKSKGDGNG